MKRGVPIGIGVGLDLAGLALIVSALEQPDWRLIVGLGLMLIGTLLITRGFAAGAASEANVEPPRSPGKWKPERELQQDPPRCVRLRPLAWVTFLAWALMFAVGGWFAYQRIFALNPPPPTANVLEAAGDVAQAEIYDLAIRDAESGPRYFLSYSFEDDTGSGVRSTVSVSKLLYDRYKVGDRLRTLYLPGDPMAHFIPELHRHAFALRGFWMGVVVAAFLLFLFGAKLFRHWRLVRSGTTAPGYVTELRRRGGGKALTVRFETRNQPRTIKAVERNPMRKQGDTVTVLYDPDKPVEAELYTLCLFQGDASR